MEAIKKLIEESKLLSNVPKPLFDRIIVKIIDAPEKKGNIIMPSNDNLSYGIVISKGDDVNNTIQIGSVVLWMGETGELLSVDEEEFVLMNYRELKAIF